MDLQYRERSSYGEWDSWADFEVGTRTIFEADHEDYAVQIRVKPEFIPGYYKYVGSGASQLNGSLRYFSYIEEGGSDVGVFERDYARYNVALAE